MKEKERIEKSVHTPVLMHEALDALALRAGMTIVDATLGGGGYSEEIIKKIGKKGTLIALDQDPDAITRFLHAHPDSAQKQYIVHSNYSDIRKVLTDRDIDHVDGIVADLGVSSDHLTQADRGFSFTKDGPLDMRMDRTRGKTAAQLLVHITQDELVHILREYGDERFAPRIARAIIAARETTPLVRTQQLADIVCGAVPAAMRHGGGTRIHPATRTFQAVRIAINNEYAHLSTFLTSAIDVLRPGGRCAIVTFHSGEARMVKQKWRAHARGCICPLQAPVCQCDHTPEIRVLTKKAVTPTKEEILHNARARSAQLRVCEKM